MKSLLLAQDMSKIEGAGMARALLLLKVMESSECPPSELAKVCRIENALIASGAPAGIVTKTIAAVLEPRNKVRRGKRGYIVGSWDTWDTWDKVEIAVSVLLLDINTA